MNNMITGKFWMKFVGRPDGRLMKGAPGNYIHGKEYHIPYGHSKRLFWELLEEVPELKVPEETDSFEEAYFISEEKVKAPPSKSDTAVIETTVSARQGSEDYVPPINAPAIIESSGFTIDGKTGKLKPYVKPEPAEPKRTEADVLKLELKKLKAELALLQKPEQVEEEPIEVVEPEVVVEEETTEEPVIEETIPEEAVEELPEEVIVDPPALDRKALLAVLAEAGEEVKKGTRTTTLQKRVDALEED